MEEWQVSGAGIAHLAGLTNLESLRLGHNDRLSDRGLVSLMEISGLPVTDAIIPVLLGLKKLKRIEMRGTRITAAGAAQLRAAGIAR